jgi:hypothetical protein
MNSAVTLWKQPYHPVMHVRVAIERHTLKISFALSFFGFDYFGRYLQSFCDGKAWHLDQIYSAIFSYSAIQIGGLLALYALLLAETNTTRRLGRTASFRRYVGFVKAGIFNASLTSFVSIPILIVSPVLGAPLAPSTLAAALWYGLSISMFFGLLRVTSVAQILIEPSWLRQEEE